jgi:Flp pilus assembly protein TadD
MNRRFALLAVSLLLSALAPNVLAQVSNARGEVKDPEGKGLEGVEVTFCADSNPGLVYRGKTDKRGRYMIGGLFSGKERDSWSATVRLAGYVPTQMKAVSRTVNGVLVSESDDRLAPEAKITGLTIVPLGTIVVDFVLTPEGQVQQQQQQAAAPAAGEAKQAAAQGGKDPWNQALSLAAQGDLEGALPEFVAAVEDQPEDAERRRAYAQTLYKLDRFPEAREQAQKAVELQPAAVDNLMVLYSIQVGLGQMEQADATLRQAAELAPGNVAVLKQRAFVAGELGDTAGEIAALEAVVAVAAADAEAWASLADLYAGAGQNEKSEQAYERVSQLDPSNAHQVFFNLGALTMSAPDRSEADTRKAINAFRKALEIKPDYQQAHKQLAFALLNVGDRAGARAALEQYVKLAPGAPDASQMQALLRTLQD